jgi:hypothetical protein
LLEIAEGKRDFPETRARRHHYVPAFLLAKFADPVGDRRGWIYQLDTSTGKPQKTTPNSACFERDLYGQTVEDGRDNAIEAFFSIVEKHAAPAIERLIADPLKLTAEDRETLSYFLALQFSRTPVALEQKRGFAKAMTTALFGMRFADPVEFARVYREKIDAEATVEEIESLRADMRLALEEGRSAIDDAKLQGLQLMLRTADAVAERVHQLWWTVIEAEAGWFVTSDRALAMHDPTPRFQWSGHAWISSPNAADDHRSRAATLPAVRARSGQGRAHQRRA